MEQNFEIIKHEKVDNVVKYLLVCVNENRGSSSCLIRQSRLHKLNKELCKYLPIETYNYFPGKNLNNLNDQVIEERFEQLNHWLCSISGDLNCPSPFAKNPNYELICDKIWKLTTDDNLAQTSPDLRNMTDKWVKDNTIHKRTNISKLDEFISFSRDGAIPSEYMSFKCDDQYKTELVDPNVNIVQNKHEKENDIDPEEKLGIEGQWELEDNINFEEQLQKGRNVNPIQCQFVLTLKQRIRITQLKYQEWNVAFEVLDKIRETNFKSDGSHQEHAELDGTKCDSITYVENNRLVNEIYLDSGTDITCRQREGDKLVTELSLNGITAKRIFKRVI